MTDMLGPFEVGKVHCCDCLAGLAALPDGSVQCIVTSPPYWGLRDYGEPGQWGLEPTYGEYIERMVKFGRAARRVLRTDGTLWLNMGDCYHSGNRGGYRNDTHRWEGCPIQSKAASTHMESVSPNRLPQSGLKDKDLVGIPWRVAFALQADGWWLRSDIIWHKPNPMPESILDRPTKAHEYIFLLTRAQKYYYDSKAIRARCDNGPQETRWFGPRPERGVPGTRPDRRREKTKVPSGWDTKRGTHGTIHREGRTQEAEYTEARVDGKHNKRTVWRVATRPYPGAHFAVFPPDLIRPCVLAGAPAGGIVCDPFAGSGTTGIVCAQTGRAFIGFDLAGGDKDLGGHTANQRIKAARKGVTLKEHKTGQDSMFGSEEGDNA